MEYNRDWIVEVKRIYLNILIIIINPQMKYLAAYALLTLSGKKDISKINIYT